LLKSLQETQGRIAESLGEMKNKMNVLVSQPGEKISLGFLCSVLNKYLSFV
jgi:hypothetical protein